MDFCNFTGQNNYLFFSEALSGLMRSDQPCFDSSDSGIRVIYCESLRILISPELVNITCHTC